MRISHPSCVFKDSGMIILTNAVSGRTDEGCLKVAQSLVKRIKQAKDDTCVVSYENRSALSDHHFELNKLLLNRQLYAFLRKRREPVLYIPFPAKTIATALRIFVLSRMVKDKLQVILVLKNHMNPLARLLLRMSGAELVVLSRQAQAFYSEIVPGDKVTYLKTGVDTQKFTPVSGDRATELKKQYGFDPCRPVVLHVGHLKYGRGVAELLKIDPQYQVLLVASTLTKDEQDEVLRQQLLSCPNIRILDTYIPNIEELYQLSDVYFFPVTESGHCIDVPLSCLEAAACGKPVITTRYGEMEAFAGKSGFRFVDTIEKDDLNRQISQALLSEEDPRDAVLCYDWDHAVSALLNT